MDIFAVDRNQTTQQYHSTKATRSHELEPQLWSLLNSYFPRANSDLRFWWKTTGVPFAILLEKAGYSIDAQRQKLFFYYYCVIPELGVGSNAQGLPRCWKSFMTDHFSPIELSWEWGCFHRNYRTIRGNVSRSSQSACNYSCRPSFSASVIEL